VVGHSHTRPNLQITNHPFFRKNYRETTTHTMVLFLLCMKCELENVGKIELRSDAYLRISVRNPLSNDSSEVRENVIVNPSQPILAQPDEGYREQQQHQDHHFQLKWDGSKKVSVLRVLDTSEAATACKKKKKKHQHQIMGPPRSYTADDAGTWVPVLAMECRGLEPYAFLPMKDEFVIISQASGCRFDQDIEFGDGDWTDYDVESDSPISVQDIQFKFEAL
jgi:hypothetical protein